MDRDTFDRLAESCEDSILARLRDYGAGAFGVLPTAERAALDALLERIAGPVTPAGPDGGGI